MTSRLQGMFWAWVFTLLCFGCGSQDDGGHARLARSRAGISAGDRESLLALHNAARSSTALGQLNGSTGKLPSATNMNALLWDPALEQVAQEYANGCTFAHNANRTTRFRELQGAATFSGNVVVGENLAIGTLGAFTATQLAAGWVNESTSYGYTPITSGRNGRALHPGRLGEDPVRRVRRRGVHRRGRRRAGAAGRLRLRDRGQLPRSAPVGRGDELRAVRGRSHDLRRGPLPRLPGSELVRGRRHHARCELRRRLAPVRVRRGLRRQGPLRDRPSDRRSEAPRWVLRQQGRLRAPGRGLPQRLQRRGVLDRGRRNGRRRRHRDATAAPARTEERGATPAPARTEERAPMPGRAPTRAVQAGRAADRSREAT